MNIFFKQMLLVTAALCCSYYNASAMEDEARDSQHFKKRDVKAQEGSGRMHPLVVQWRSEEVVDSDELRHQVVKLLGNTLQKVVDAKLNDSQPNIAIARLIVKDNSNQQESIVEFPYFFLSGWNRDAYLNKLTEDQPEFGTLLKNTVRGISGHYMSYDVQMLKDLFPNGKLEDFKKYLSAKSENLLGNKKLAGLDVSEFNQRYLHSEQAIFLFLENEISRIKTVFSNHDFTLDVLSFWPVCKNCQDLSFIQGASIKVQSTSIEKKQIVKKKLKQEEVRTDSSLKETKKHKKSNSVSEYDEENEFNSMLSELTKIAIKESNPIFIEFLISKISAQSSKFKKEFLKEGTINLDELNTIKIKATPQKNFVTIGICDLIQAYTYITTRTPELSGKKQKIRDNLAKLKVSRLGGFASEKDKRELEFYKTAADHFISLCK